MLDVLNSRIVSQEQAVHIIAGWRLLNKKIVFTNGCFDLLHLGHVDYLAKAKDLGDKLIVGLNSDSSVKMQQKGPSRPLQDERSRSLIMASLHMVDMVIIFNEETPKALIELLQPDVLVKGADYKVEDIAGHESVLARGGKVELIEFVPGYSTSLIEKKIRNS